MSSKEITFSIKLLLIYNKVQISSLLYRSNNKKYLNYNHRCHLLNSIFSKNIWRVSNRVSSDASMHNFHSRNWQKNWQMSSQRNIHKAISICFPLKGWICPMLRIHGLRGCHEGKIRILCRYSMHLSQYRIKWSSEKMALTK